MRERAGQGPLETRGLCWCLISLSCLLAAWGGSCTKGLLDKGPALVVVAHQGGISVSLPGIFCQPRVTLWRKGQTRVINRQYSLEPGTNAEEEVIVCPKADKSELRGHFHRKFSIGGTFHACSSHHRPSSWGLPGPLPDTENSILSSVNQLLS